MDCPVALPLVAGRTAFSCRSHYFKNLNTKRDKDKQTRLETLYERYGFKSSFGPVSLASVEISFIPVLMIFIGTDPNFGNL